MATGFKEGGKKKGSRQHVESAAALLLLKTIFCSMLDAIRLCNHSESELNAPSDAWWFQLVLITLVSLRFCSFSTAPRRQL